MGFLDKLLRTMPGGPASVAKNLFTNYNKIKMRSPNLEDKEIFRELLESRYAVLKTIRKEQLDEIIETSDNLVSFTLDVLSAENPAAMQTPYFQATFHDICKFYRDNAPSEYAKFKKFMSSKS